MLFGLAVVLFILLVVVHELGHFLVARRNGVEVEEFGIFFPPRLATWKRKHDKTVYSLNLIPLGGFVQLKGESDTDKTPGSYGRASLKVKTKIMLAGVAMNLLAAFIVFTGLSLTGMPQLVENQFSVASDAKVVRDVDNKGVVFIAKVVENSPAAAAGLKVDDQLVALDGTKISQADSVAKLAKDRAGQKVTLIIKRDGQMQLKEATLNAGNSGTGYLGVATQSKEAGLKVVRSTWSAPVVAAGTMGQLTKLSVTGLGHLLADLFAGNGSQAADQVTGPVGIVRILKDNSNLGLAVVLWLIAYISLTLAIMNLLPIPALDGGKLYTTLTYRVLRKRLTPKAEQIIYGTSFALLLVLFVVVTYIDVKR